MNINEYKAWRSHVSLRRLGAEFTAIDACVEVLREAGPMRAVDIVDRVTEELADDEDALFNMDYLQRMLHKGVLTRRKRLVKSGDRTIGIYVYSLREDG